jgi:polyisoprenoid-binding protein YceI
MRTRTCLGYFAGILLVICGTTLAASPVAIDTQRSALTIRVFKTGFFSGFAHDHEISAPITGGTFSVNPPSAELSIDARRLQVQDKDVSASDRDKIQQKMLGPEVLDTEQFKEISFRSTRVESAREDVWQVTGNLTLHGQTHPVTFKVQKAVGRYLGSVTIKQSDFGIAPISIAGGSVKVKDEVRIEFDVAGK